MPGGLFLEHGVHGGGLLDLERVKKVLALTRQKVIDAMHFISFENLDLTLKGLKNVLNL